MANNRWAILLVDSWVEVKDGQDCPSYVWMTPMASALCIDRDDNVATLLEDAAPGPIWLLGETSSSVINAIEPMSRGHKVALRPLAAGETVIKYGVTIGNTTSDIPAGAWVHTHNCASPLDARSATLDQHTGAPTDTKYE